MENLYSFAGLLGLLGVAWLLSVDRKAISWRPVIWGVALQLAVGAVVLIPGLGEALFAQVDVGMRTLLSYADAGSAFVLQGLEPHQVSTVGMDGEVVASIYPPQAGDPRAMSPWASTSPALKNLAFWVIPSVIFFSALMALLYHYGIMQFIVRAVARVMQRTMGNSGAESLSAAANIFVGQTEAPLVIRPFVSTMTTSELHAVMLAGFATVAGGVMAIYVGVLGDIDGIAAHLIIASLMSAPAALAVAKIMVPETGTPDTLGKVELKLDSQSVNGIDALARGTLDGLTLCLNILAMLFVFVAMIAMVNGILGWVGDLVGIHISLEWILGWVFAPFAFLMGIPWGEALSVGTLLGEKLVLTEIVAFLHLSEIQAGADPTIAALSQRSAVITSYALCGFANFASVGIQIGGIGGIAPERRADLARLGMRAMIGGALATMMTGAVAGMLYTG